MNNRGQSLVLFVLIIPILFLLFITVYDIGSMSLLKQELDGINYLAIDYGIDNIDDEDIENKVKALIIKNRKNIDKIEVTKVENKINVVLEDSLNTKISFGNKVFKVKSSYVGYLDDDNNKIIERNK